MATAAANRSKTTKPSKSAARADERRASGTDAIEMLKDDHERVDALFKRYEKGKDAMSADERKALAREICAELDVHTTLEEEIFYPAARAAG
jgi:hemerythrin superfamily protein